ncbi:flagellar export protein FliJ [Virgibacillus soli]|uniref:Flagellar FliJ protein n=1 Tax=Paracerasibacillus soli TaxID=480284 RepID=A0ABU5CP91_9BACI|nr:flagellar export protein FliJ [Virgibacillus soli]MDY0408159.1 flagellar export protein FliJ [Virgibacillus soli]
MAEIAVFSKIKSIKDREKMDAQKAYHQSMEIFETIGTKLYNLLRKKEDAEQSYENYLQQQVPIEKVKEQILYIEMLNKKIVDLQREIQLARNDMEMKQEVLTEAYVEVKKFEKIIENRNKEKRETELRLENNMMDEISIRQFMNNR